jgi:hypothetical protein
VLAAPAFDIFFYSANFLPTHKDVKIRQNDGAGSDRDRYRAGAERPNIFTEKKNGSREESRETRDGGGTDARENAAVGTSNAQGRVEFRRIDAEEAKASGQIVSGDRAALCEEA